MNTYSWSPIQRCIKCLQTTVDGDWGNLWSRMTNYGKSVMVMPHECGDI